MVGVDSVRSARRHRCAACFAYTTGSYEDKLELGRGPFSVVVGLLNSRGFRRLAPPREPGRLDAVCNRLPVRARGLRTGLRQLHAVG